MKKKNNQTTKESNGQELTTNPHEDNFKSQDRKRMPKRKQPRKHMYTLGIGHVHVEMLWEKRNLVWWEYLYYLVTMLQIENGI